MRGGCLSRPTPFPRISMLESKNYFSKKSEPRCSSATTTLKFRAGGKAAAARLTLSIDEGWSVQHLNPGKYVLKKYVNAFLPHVGNGILDCDMWAVGT